MTAARDTHLLLLVASAFQCVRLLPKNSVTVFTSKGHWTLEGRRPQALGALRHPVFRRLRA